MLQILLVRHSFQMHCVKSKQQRTREYMRNQRSQRRANEVSQIIQVDEDEDEVSPKDISNTTNEAMDTDNSDAMVFECSMGSPISYLLNDSSSNSSENSTNTDEALDSGSLDEDINKFMRRYDLNNQTKLYPSCPLSIRDACLTIVKLARRLNLDKNGMKHLLDCIRNLSPIDVKLPRTFTGLMEVIGKDRFFHFGD